MDKRFSFSSKDKTGLFDVSEQFFVIDSSSLGELEVNDGMSRLYGYCIIDSEVIDSASDLGGRKPDGTGAYVFVRGHEGAVTITQDSVGSYGLCLYENDGYWAISNSFFYLVDYVKESHRLTMNGAFADYLLTCDLCSTSYEETLASEIKVLDRRSQIHIDIRSAKLSVTYVDYLENTVDLDSESGMALLDNWRTRWAQLLANILQTSTNVTCDLSGGFDSRLALSLFAGKDSRDLLKRISIHTFEDSLHTHASDYEYASRIAGLLGLELNNTEMLSSELLYHDIDSILAISLYTKLGFHRQMYFKHNFHVERKYAITGFGGECVRDYWNMSRAEYIESLVERGIKYSSRFRAPIQSVLDTAFDDMIRVHNGLGKPIPEVDMLLNLYRDTRCRNHFGRSTVESFLSNSVNLSPLLDADLHRLKLTTDDCPDKNLLAAIIIGRYCPELRDLDFEGNRSINPATLQTARRINEKYPLNSSVKPTGQQRERVGAQELPAMKRNERVANGAPDRELQSYYYRRVKGTMFLLFDEKVCRLIEDRVSRVKYFPFSDMYCAIAIGTVYDLQRSRELLAKPAAYNILHGDDALRKVDLSGKPFDDNPVVERYKTARVDIRAAGGDARFDVHSVSPGIKASRPEWLNKNGFGYVLTFSQSVLSVLVKCTSSGPAEICLRSTDVRTESGWHVPIWMEFKSLQVNGEEFISSPAMVHHDRPRIVKIDMHSGEEYAILATCAPASPAADEVYQKDCEFKSRQLG